MKMKRKTTALLLALMMCLLLLSACGANNTPDAEEPQAPVNTSAEQQPADEEVPEETEEPEEEEPEEAAEPEQEEVEEQNNAGIEFLALLQEEYENGFVNGEGARHVYYKISQSGAFIDNGIVYIEDDRWGSEPGCLATYDITSKEFNENGFKLWDAFYIDGNFYRFDENYCYMYDCNGTPVNTYKSDYRGFFRYVPFDKGFFCGFSDGSLDHYVLLSYDLEEIAKIAVPQREIEHGLKEDMSLSSAYAADGTLYAIWGNENSWYRLNTDTYEWENTGNAYASINGESFYGKYVSCNDGIYDRITGERVFEYGDLYAPYPFGSYFGGDKYLGYRYNGYNGDEYRWVNLTDLSMSDPLPFPEEVYAHCFNDTYCVYHDEYGYFLWNYNDGTEETIVMSDN